MKIDSCSMGALEVAASVKSGAMSARQSVEACAARIASRNPQLHAFTATCLDRALQQAAQIDARRARGEPLGTLAGAVFAAKNLFDIAGLPTLAGSKINASDPPAKADASLIQRLEQADAILIGALNMGEYAYDFTGENAHYGHSRNPHDPTRMSGGSSGGSATAVASGMTHFSLGSDTNGSIRAPASLCGLFGLKPTYGRLSRAGSFPFVSSLDHAGLFARSALDLAVAYDVAQGPDDKDPVQARRPVELTADALAQGVSGLRIAKAGGYFARGGDPACFAAVDQAAETLGAVRSVDIPDAHRARAAAYVITMAEGGSLHLNRLRQRYEDFDPDVRDRLIAGAMTPSPLVVRAQKFRRLFRDRVAALFQEVDAIIAPATPCRAPLIGQKTIKIGGVESAVRANLGVFTQPISFIGLPVVCAPTWTAGESLPIGVQIIAPAWREDVALRVAHALERGGLARAPIA
ncbi:MAG: AtzE family amidohydrolase [Beijerinckiaceae bacterium]|jgi:AtzE family amidohydrolase